MDRKITIMIEKPVKIPKITKHFVLENVMPQAISYKRCAYFIKSHDLAFKQFFDIAMIFRVELSNNEDGVASFRVRTEHLDALHITMHELMEAARSNIAWKLTETSLNPAPDDPRSMFKIITTEDHFYGAAAIFVPETARKYKNHYIWASSVHELMAAPVEALPLYVIKEILRDVNRDLEPDFYLSDSVFYSDGERISVV